jgi:uncharacterized protein (DUF58 family)
LVKNRIVYAISVAGTAAVMFFLGTSFAYTVFYSLIILPLLSFAALSAAPFFIRISEEVEKTDVFKNEGLNYSAYIYNRSFLPYPNVTFLFYRGDYVRYEKQSADPVNVSSKESVMDGYTVSFPFRGKFSVGIEKFYVTDFLGLFRMGFSKKNPVEVTVFPEKIENFAPDLRSELLSKTVSAFDFITDSLSEVSDVRKYEPSDDYKKIHWKLTAKRNEFIVKNFSSSVLNKTYIYLDTKKTPLTGKNRLRFEDKMVSFAAAAAGYCLMKRQPCSVNYGASPSDWADILSFADFDILFRLFAELEFTGASYLARSLKESLNDDDFYNMVFFISDIENDLFDVFTSLSAMGHNVIIYYLINEGEKPDEDTQNFLSVLSDSGVSVNFI